MKRIILPILLLIALIFLSQTLPIVSTALAKRLDLPDLVEAMYYDKLDGKQVRCNLCPRYCIIPNKKKGFCRARENRDGVLYSLVYGKPCAIHADPIEKKPLYHVLPGTKSFSIATAGCNLACKFCQNWQISQASPEDVPYDQLAPDDLVRVAIANKCPSIAYTYTEPTVFYEYMYDTAKIARELGVLNVMHSAGYINEEPLRQLCKYLDAANIDLKGSDKFYNDLTLGRRDDVLRTLKILKEEGVWTEITYLLIPTLNDDPEYIKETSMWIKENLGPDTPLHLSRFWPTYKLQIISPTPVETLEKAANIAMAAGLRYVYIGNIRGNKGGITHCPHCDKPIVKRIGYNVIENNIKEGKCGFCAEKIAGIWNVEDKSDDKI
ncbi:AmmeMemoRadiSam system radical SAM enzyme [Candidatus Omnitrophota bacterium]